MPNWVTNKMKIDALPNRVLDVLNAIRHDNGPLGSFDFDKVIPMPASLDIRDGTITTEAISAYLSKKGTTQEKDLIAKAALDHILQYQLRDIQFMTASEISEVASKHGMQSNEFVQLGKQYVDNLREYGALTWYSWRCDNWGTKWNIESNTTYYNGEDTLIFETAWSTPEPLIKTLSEQFPDISIAVSYADEDIGSNVGQYIYKAGNCIDKYTPTPQSVEAYELAFDLWDISPEACCLRFNEVENTYEYYDPSEDLDDRIANAQQRAGDSELYGPSPNREDLIH